MDAKRCTHLMHLPSGKCLGCGEQHQPLPDYKPGDDKAYLDMLLEEARPQPTPSATGSGERPLDMCRHGADRGSYCGYCGGYSKGAEK